MDISKFSESKTGELVEISYPFPDHAFVPDAIPSNWEFPDELWPQLVLANKKLGKLDGIGQTLPNPELLLHPLQNREALRSSSLEGTYATPEELLLFEMEPSEPKSEKDKANAWLEVANYRKALREGFHYIGERDFSLGFVRNLHEWLMSGVRGEDKSPGQFRDCQVYIGSDRRFVPPPTTFLNDCLISFEECLRDRIQQADPLIACYMLHYQFEAIHPFNDGNGRVGRLLLALTTWRWCDLSTPWLYMSAFFEKHKDEYIDSMFDVSASGNWTEFLALCLRGTIAQADDSIQRCEKLQALKDSMHNRMVNGSNRMYRIIEDLFSSPMVTIPRLRDRLEVSYPTAKTDVKSLEAEGILKRLEGNRRPAFYYSPDIFDIAYREE